MGFCEHDALNTSLCKEMIVWAVVVLTLLIIGISAACYFADQRHFPVPKTIWTYVRPTDDPVRVERCAASWKRHHPTFRIYVLTEETYQGYVNHLPRELNYTQRGAHHHPVFRDSFSSLLRLYLLAEYGGIWLDPDVELKRPLDRWLFDRPATFAAICCKGGGADAKPVIDTWLLACVQGHEWVIHWRDELTRAAEFASMDKYVESRRKNTVISLSMTPDMVAAQSLLQHEKTPDKMMLWLEDDPIVLGAVHRG